MADSASKPFRMPIDNEQGPRCDCGTILNSVYRSERKDRFVFRERICPRCRRKITTLERVIEIVE